MVTAKSQRYFYLIFLLHTLMSLSKISYPHSAQSQLHFSYTLPSSAYIFPLAVLYLPNLFQTSSKQAQSLHFSACFSNLSACSFILWYNLTLSACILILVLRQISPQLFMLISLKLLMQKINYYRNQIWVVKMHNQRIYLFKMRDRGRENQMQEKRVYRQLVANEEEEEDGGKNGRPVLELEIQLENGSKVYINPNPTDEPVRLATQFCEEYNLDEEMIDILAESIKRSITHGSYKKQPPNHAIPPKQKKLNFIAQSCKTREGKSPQYFSKKFSVNSNLGLYEKGVMLEDAKKHWVARQHEHRRMEEMRECTHKPRINELSRSLVSERPRPERPEKCASKELLSLRSSILVETKPTDNTPLQQRKSDYNISRSSSSVFLKLYENRQIDEISRSKILSQMLKEETHHPIINNISKEIVGNAKFNERLIKYQKSKLEKNFRLKKSELMEKENLYKPKVGPPPANRNIDNLPIGDFLYNKKKKPQVIKHPKQQPHINQASKAIYQKRKATAFQRIFDYLDFQNTNKIAWNLLDQAIIEPSLLAVLRPLLEQIEIMQIELSPDDFKAALEFLFGTLSPTDKGIILNFNPKRKKPSSSQYHSIQMNKNSSMIARNIGRSKFSIYDYCEIKQALRLQKLQNERIENERREMRECTFQPNIQKKSIYY